MVGARLYTSPDPKFASSVLERGPGTCPHTKRPLVPVPATRDRAGTAMRFDPAKNTHVLLPAAQPGSAAVASSGYTVEAWVRPAAASGTILAHHTGASPTSTFAVELDADRKLVADLGGTRVVSGTAVPVNAYVHVAAVFDGKNASVYIGGVRAGVRAVTAVPDARSAASVGAKLVSGTPEAGFKGDVDEVRVWERARTEARVRRSGAAPVGHRAGPGGVLPLRRGGLHGGRRPHPGDARRHGAQRCCVGGLRRSGG
ncbi:LamG domain-containing protein [Embleya sp. NPDC020630]|uniref:LamG domain-containing protein n=1 Tax=Embleya sp. NPDC020630 TaxID=3363979 RepID=UPI00378DE155